MKRKHEVITTDEEIEAALLRAGVWERIVKEPLFQFLKHDGTGRTIMCLFANGQISLGKAAEAITEKFCLGLDPTLPEWRGYDAKDDTSTGS